MELEAGEKIRKTDEHCTNLSYHVFTAVKSSAALIVELTGPHYCEGSTLTDITVHIINLTECLRGFELDFDRCVCERRLQQYFGEDIACDVDSESVLRKGTCLAEVQPRTRAGDQQQLSPGLLLPHFTHHQPLLSRPAVCQPSQWHLVW